MIVFVVIALAGVVSSCASNSDEEQLDLHWFTYHRAMEIQDWDVARMSVYQIMALDTNNKAYYDTLAQLYASSQDWNAAYHSSTKSLAYNFSESSLRVAYLSSSFSGRSEDAIKHGERLLELHADSIELMYEISDQHLKLKQLDKVEELLNKVILNPKSGEVLRVEQVSQQRVQKVPYRACAYNVLGYLALQRGDDLRGLEMFERSLNSDSTYMVALNNLQLTKNAISDRAK